MSLFSIWSRKEVIVILTLSSLLKKSSTVLLSILLKKPEAALQLFHFLLQPPFIACATAFHSVYFLFCFIGSQSGTHFNFFLIIIFIKTSVVRKKEARLECFICPPPREVGQLADSRAASMCSVTTASDVSLKPHTHIQRHTACTPTPAHKHGAGGMHTHTNALKCTCKDITIYWGAYIWHVQHPQSCMCMLVHTWTRDTQTEGVKQQIRNSFCSCLAAWHMSKRQQASCICCCRLQTILNE